MIFNLNPDLDVARLARLYAETGRVQVQGFLHGDCAQALHSHLKSRTDWTEVLNSGDKVVELSREIQAGLSDAQKTQLADAVYHDARHGFQYRYETIRVEDAKAARDRMDDKLNRFAIWLSEGTARDILRHITGAPDIDFADAQATAYSPGHFLTGHDDNVAGKMRKAAYVFGLTPTWRAEWGGLLLFHGNGGETVQGLVPMFNTLNLFAVPQMHSVSEVTRAAAYRRYAVTGWLRANP